MKRAFATRTLVAIAGLAIAGSSYWIAAPGTHASSAIAAITRGERPAIPAQSVARRHAPSASAPASLQALPPAAHDASASTVETAPRDKLASLRAPLSPDSANDPFSVLSWLPPPPPPPAPPPVVVQPAARTVPPLPFGFVGAMNGDAAKPQVFLSSGDRLLIVSPGEVIDGQYRIESIAATGVVFTYLPLNVQQVMSTQGDGK